MARTMDDLKMVHEEEMKNYDRIESAVVSVMRRHGCKIIQTPTFEDYDTYGTYFPQLQREMIKTIGPDGEVLAMNVIVLSNQLDAAPVVAQSSQPTSSQVAAAQQA